ncbi:hypothetical protein GIB67_005314 [Kingdonia uniflora]|uniref:Uncharacterized protein n=1 Tax=Kingdonia uniflora TaxID=39325 RepID=A0A7J7LFW8_9MAGN|nr:hypothetical protein GIB67_005314 [Kingdonia uniflora]
MYAIIMPYVCNFQGNGVMASSAVINRGPRTCLRNYHFFTSVDIRRERKTPYFVCCSPFRRVSEHSGGCLEYWKLGHGFGRYIFGRISSNHCKNK